MTEDTNNDVTAPCPDCGEVAIPCECGKPIETVAQLQRALEAAGKSLRVSSPCVGTWVAEFGGVTYEAGSLSDAISGAIDFYWHST